MSKEFAKLMIAGFGISLFFSPKAQAQNFVCSNFWINPTSGRQECLDVKMQASQPSATAKSYSQNHTNS